MLLHNLQRCRGATRCVRSANSLATWDAQTYDFARPADFVLRSRMKLTSALRSAVASFV